MHRIFHRIFNRSTTEYFALNIMCRTGSESNFSLNGNQALIPSSAFHPVAGTGGNWKSAQISYTPVQIPVGNPSVISNNHPSDNFFHLGIIHGGNSTGCRFGYFSDYNSLNLGGNRTICANDTLMLDAGFGKNPTCGTPVIPPAF
jgi:hypothetical protein